MLAAQFITSRMPVRRVLAGAAGVLLAAQLAGAPAAFGAEAVTYLFPAPPSLPAFGPIRLANGKGYFMQAGIDVSFAVGRGGVDVAKQVGAGNAPFGGIVADGPIMVRQNGVPIKIVAVFGGRGFMQLVVRDDSGIQKPADLKGKTISVMSFQDTTYYALLGLLASAGLTKDDLNIQSAGPAGVWEFVATGKAAGMAGVPDWIPPVQAAGVKVRVIQTDEFFPHMAQAIGVSDQVIKDKPELRRQVRRGGAARHEGHHGRSQQGRRRFRLLRSGMEGQGRRGEGHLQLLRHAGLSGPAAARRDQCRAPAQPAGFLSREGHHPAQDADGGAVHQSVHQVSAAVPERPVARTTRGGYFFSVSSPRKAGIRSPPGWPPPTVMTIGSEPDRRIESARLAQFVRELLEAASVPTPARIGVGNVADLGEPARRLFPWRAARATLPRSSEEEDHEPGSNIRVERRAGAIVVLEADRAPGAIAMTRAMAEAIACARETHIGWCAARNITHAGAIGYFALQAAQAGFAGIVMTASGPLMAYHGARVAGVSTNPLAIAFPGNKRPPFLIDMSTSTVAMGKLLNARDSGREIPPDWGIDAQGRATTDARKVATLLPMAGPKGSGLSFMIECLCSLTVHNPIVATALEGGGSLDNPFLNGVALAIDLSAFGDAESIRREADRLGDAIADLRRRKVSKVFCSQANGEPQSCSSASGREYRCRAAPGSGCWRPPRVSASSRLRKVARTAGMRAAVLRMTDYFASGSGRSWMCTARGLLPLPPSISHGVRSPFVLHSPRPFQPAFGSSMRPSRPLA